MATYYWQGSTTGAGIARYDWNYGPNWKLFLGSNIAFWPTSLTAPGAGDIAVVGDKIVARSPLLFGGYSGSVASGNWLNVGSTGTTFNSSLNAFSAYMTSPRTTSNGGRSFYPFPWLGGGITGDVYNWAVNVDGLDSATITGITGARANLGLTLKVAYDNTVVTTGRINSSYDIGGVDGNGYPNYSVVNLKYVQSKHYNNGGTAATQTSLSLLGGSWAGASGGALPSPVVGLGNVAIQGGAFKTINIDNGISGAIGGTAGTTARPYNISFNNLVCDAASMHNGDINIDRSCTFGTLTIKSGSNPYYLSRGDEERQYSRGFDGREINLCGTFNSVSSASALGWAAPSATASPFVSGVYLYDQYATVPGNADYDYIPTILIGNPSDGATFTAQTVAVFNEVSPYSTTTSGNAQRPWRIEFFGDTNITAMSTEGTTIAAWAKLDQSKQININRLTMAENSTLDLNYAPMFDAWYFGTLTGNQVAGGIGFADGTCTIRGSAGVRLYNTKIVNNFDFRAGKEVPISYSIYDTSASLPSEAV